VSGGLRRYAVLSWHLARAGYLSSTRDRVDLLLGIVTNVVRQSVSLALIGIVLSHFQVLAGWSLPAIALLIGLRSMSHGIFVAFLNPIRGIQNQVRRGELDRMLVRPIGVLYQAAFGGTIELLGCGDFIVGFGYFVYAMVGLHVRWTVPVALFSVLATFSGVAIEFAVYLASGVVAFWTLQDSPLYALTYLLHERLALYPISMYGQVVQFLMSWVVPIGFINFFPAAVFFAHSRLPMPTGLTVGLGWLTPLIAAASSAAALGLWRLAVRRYESTGS
jgi:ABC-2 type transport system permease protein